MNPHEAFKVSKDLQRRILHLNDISFIFFLLDIDPACFHIPRLTVEAFPSAGFENRENSRKAINFLVRYSRAVGLGGVTIETIAKRRVYEDRKFLQGLALMIS